MLAVSSAFSSSLPRTSPTRPTETTSLLAASSAAMADEAPPLRRNPPRNIVLLVEPTPFTHVSGYVNRFKEMLRYLSKAGDNVDILTVDAKTTKEDLPKESFGYNIEHTQGFVFPLYHHISLTVNLPEMKGAKIMERRRPDLIHVASLGIMLFAGLFYARVMHSPLLLSYHTHLPLYGRNYLSFAPGVEEICWALLRFAHSRADLTLVTSPQMKEELEANGIPRVGVWRKGIDTIIRFQPKFKSTETREKMKDGNPNECLMVYVGRLGAEKRLKDIKPVLEKLSGARLCIVGTQLQVVTSMTPRSPPEVLTRLLSQVDCCLLFSVFSITPESRRRRRRYKASQCCHSAKILRLRRPFRWFLPQWRRLVVVHNGYRLRAAVGARGVFAWAVSSFGRPIVWWLL